MTVNGWISIWFHTSNSRCYGNLNIIWFCNSFWKMFNLSTLICHEQSSTCCQIHNDPVFQNSYKFLSWIFYWTCQAFFVAWASTFFIQFCKFIHAISSDKISDCLSYSLLLLQLKFLLHEVRFTDFSYLVCAANTIVAWMARSNETWIIISLFLV